MRTPSLKLLDVCNTLSVVKNLNNALFMACLDLNDMDKTNALQSVIDEINTRLEALDGLLDEVREDLA